MGTRGHYGGKMMGSLTYYTGDSNKVLYPGNYAVMQYYTVITLKYYALVSMKYHTVIAMKYYTLVTMQYYSVIAMKNHTWVTMQYYLLFINL